MMKKKILSVFIAVIMVAAMFTAFAVSASAAEVASGTSGDVSWTLSDDGTLTVSGEGAMADHSNGSQPWYAHKDSIKTVIVTKGVTTISPYAFYEFPALATVKIAGSVTAIGNNAFAMCSNLSNVEYYGSSNPMASDTAFFGSYAVVKVLSSYSGNVFCGKMARATLDAANEPLPPCDHAGHTQTGCTACGATDGSIHTFTETSNGFCTVCGGYEPATLNADGYYEIDNAGKLYWFASEVNGGNTAINGKLTKDIVVNEGTMTAGNTGARAWTPIGNNAYSYTGTFDGADFTVSGLSVNTSAHYQGFFGYVGAGGTVKNVGVINSYIKGGNNVGGVVGCNKGTVSDCHNAGTTVIGLEYVGGVVGDNDGNVQSCSNESDVSGERHVGGITGYNGEESIVANCCNEGTVSGSADGIGGVVGNNRSTVQSNYNTGEVTANGGYVGGVVGYNTILGTVQSSYNTGEVSGVYYAGGVVGYNGKVVENCYNIGSVSGARNVGGVVGYNSEKESLVQNCYNKGAVSATEENGGGVIGYKGLSTVANCYYLDTCGATGSGSSKTEEQIESGEVAMLLGDAFGQSLDNGETVNGIPVFRTETNEVYYRSECDGTMIYSNSAKPETHKAGVSAANYFDENGVCLVCGAQAAANLSVPNDLLYFATLEDAVAAAQHPSAEGSTIMLLDDVVTSVASNITSGKFIIDLNGHTVTGVALSNSGNLTITGSGSYNGDIDNRGTMVINANVGGNVEAYEGKLTVIGGTIQSLVVYGDDIVSLKGGTFNELKIIIDNMPMNNSVDLSKNLYKILAYGKLYSHSDIETARYKNDPYEGMLIDVNGNIGHAWFTSPVSVLEDDPVIPTISTQPVGADYTMIDTADALVVGATNNDDGGTLSYQWYSDTDGDAIGGTAITGATKATYTPKKVVGTTYYYCVVTNSKTGFDSQSTTSSAAKVTVTKATPTLSDFTSILPIVPVYNGETVEIDVTAEDGIVGMGAITVWYKDADRNRLTGLPTNAGTYYVYIDVAEGDNYEAITEFEIGSFTIEKATPVVTAPTAIEDLIYSGDALALINAGSTTGGTLKYGVIEGEYNSASAYGPLFEEAIPTATDAGSYIIFYMVEGDDNYKDVTMQHITVTIGKAKPTLDVTSPTPSVLPGNTILLSCTLTGVKGEELTNTVAIINAKIGEDNCDIDGLKVTVPSTAVIGGEDKLVVTLRSLEDGNYNDSEVFTLTLDIGMADFSGEIAALEADIEELNEMIENKADADEIAEKLTDIENRVKSIENNMATDDALAAVIVAAKAELTTAYEKAIENAVSDLEAKIDAQIDPTELAAEIKKVTDLIDALDDTYATDAKLAEAITKAENELKAAVSTLETKLGEEVTKLQNQIASNDTDIADIKAQITEINGLIDALEAADVTLDGRITDAINKAKAELDSAVEALEAKLGEEVTKLQNQIASNDTDIADIKAQITEINGLIDALEAADVTLDGRITDAINKAKTELDSARAELEKLIAGVQTNLDNAKSELDTAIANLDAAMKKGDADLSDEIANLNTALTNAKAALEKADADNKAELEGKITEAQNTLQSAIDKVAKDLADAEKELADAIASGDAALSSRISSVSASLSAAKTALEKADSDNKAELIAKIEAAENTLNAAIKAVQKNLDDAKAELNKAIADGDTELDGKITALNDALATAKAALEAADTANKSELTTKIDEADVALQAAIDALSSELNSVKQALENKDAELESKDSELQTFIIIVCVISGVAFCGCGTLAVFYFIDKKKKI